MASNIISGEIIGGTPLEIKDEGGSLSTSAKKIDFAGAGVTATEPTADEILVTIPGGGNSLAVEDEGSPLTAAATKLNFAGSGVTVTEPVTDEMLVTIPGGNTVPYQEKFLTVDLTANTSDIADLRFSNLEIGKTYRVTAYLNCKFLTSTGNGVFLIVRNDTGNPGMKLQVGFAQNTSGTGDEMQGIFGGSTVFVATTTTMTCDAIVASGASMESSATLNNTTRVLLEELPGHSVTTQWT